MLMLAHDLCYILKCYATPPDTYESDHRTGHPVYPAVQLRLTCDQIRTGFEL